MQTQEETTRKIENILGVFWQTSVQTAIGKRFIIDEVTVKAANALLENGSNVEALNIIETNGVEELQTFLSKISQEKPESQKFADIVRKTTEELDKIQGVKDTGRKEFGIYLKQQFNINIKEKLDEFDFQKLSQKNQDAFTYWKEIGNPDDEKIVELYKPEYKDLRIYILKVVYRLDPSKNLYKSSLIVTESFVFLCHLLHYMSNNPGINKKYLNILQDMNLINRSKDKYVLTQKYNKQSEVELQIATFTLFKEILSHGLSDTEKTAFDYIVDRTGNRVLTNQLGNHILLIYLKYYVFSQGYYTWSVFNFSGGKYYLYPFESMLKEIEKDITPSTDILKISAAKLNGKYKKLENGTYVVINDNSNPLKEIIGKSFEDAVYFALHKLSEFAGLNEAIMKDVAANRTKKGGRTRVKMRKKFSKKTHKKYKRV